MSTSLILDEPECIAAVGDQCGEGAVWHPEHAALYWTDINRFLIHRWLLATRSIATWKFEEPVTALNLTSRDDLLLVALGSRLMLWSPDPGTEVHDPALCCRYALPGWPAIRCNDARVDPAGGLWVATMQNNVAADGAPLPVHQALGSLFSFDAAGAAQVWRTRLGIGNTIAWSPDQRFLYTADTLADEIWRYQWGGDSSIANGKLWFDKTESQERGLPDGSAMDSEGYLWNCRHGGGCILRIDPDGRVDRVISLPVKNPTTCVFGGRENRTLYVTSAAIEDDSPESGGLFAIETSVAGLPANRFRLLAEEG